MNNMYLKMMAQGGRNMPKPDKVEIVPVEAMQEIPEIPQMDGRISDIPMDQYMPAEGYSLTPEELQLMGLSEEDIARDPSSDPPYVPRRPLVLPPTKPYTSFWKRLLGVK
jgi:hypothetical protein